MLLYQYKCAVDQSTLDVLMERKQRYPQSLLFALFVILWCFKIYVENGILVTLYSFSIANSINQYCALTCMLLGQVGYTRTAHKLSLFGEFSTLPLLFGEITRLMIKAQDRMGFWKEKKTSFHIFLSIKVRYVLE